MARDEWPMLELAITHALLNHVDEVVVVDHGSTDETREQLPQLEARWAGRLKVLRLDGVPYLQEAVTLTALASVPWDAFDWVYVFDADEFLVTETGDVRDYLENVGTGYDTVRYSVLNFLAPRHFDERNLREYTSITKRARVSRLLDIPGSVTAEEIELGEVNFFAEPFAAKVIVRSAKDLWLEAGAHVIHRPEGSREVMADVSEVYAAHLPFPSWSRVQRKVLQGQELVAQGFDPEHGWQAQMLARLEKAGQLEGFWEAHSLGEQSDASQHRAQPLYEHDDSFSLAIGVTLGSLQAGNEEQLPRIGPDPRQIDASTYLGVIHEQMQAVKALTVEVRERAEIARERDHLTVEVASLLDWSAKLETQLDAVSKRARELQDVVQVMESSSSWRYTKPLREAMGSLRSHLRTLGV
jgi:hypothetical protein